MVTASQTKKKRSSGGVTKSSSRSCTTSKLVSKCRQSNLKVSSNHVNHGRNPFWLFLADFRKTHKKLYAHLPAYYVGMMAGRVWKEMTPIQKSPFIEAARDTNYTFKLKNPKANWVIEKLRRSLSADKFDPEKFWMVVQSIQNWRKCVLKEIIPKKDNQIKEEE